jgi:YD repeat-containing protein
VGALVAFLVRSRLAIAASSLAIASVAFPSSAQVTTTYTYDDQGQVKTVVRSNGTVAYTYDAAGNRTAIGVTPPAPLGGNLSANTAYATPVVVVAAPSGAYTNMPTLTQPTRGTLSGSNLTWTYTPSSTFYGGTDSWTYRLDGPGGSSPIYTVVVTVGAPPAPGASNGTLTVGYNSAASLIAPTTGAATGLVVDVNPAKGTVSTSGTTFTYTATYPNYGADTFTYHATGPGGSSSSRTISVNIANGAAPGANNGSALTAYNAPVTITYPISGDYAVGALDSQPAHGSVSAPTYVSGVGTRSTYTPQAGYIGADSWTFHATSPFGNSPVRTFTVTTGAPAAPIVSNTSLTAIYNANGAVALPVSGLYTSIAFPGGPSHGSLSLSGATVTYTPVAGYYGADTFTYNATGPGGTSASATVNVNVPRPPPPTVSNSSLTANYGSYGSSGVLALPATGYVSSISFPTAPTQGSISLSGSTVTYVGFSGRVGADSFTYNATGPGGTSTTATVSVNIIPPAAPTAGNVSADVPYNTATNVPLAITGIETITDIYAGASHGVATSHGSYVTYLPTSGYSGPDSFQYIVRNPGGYSGVATVSVNVAAPPAAPQPTPQPDPGEVHSQGTITLSPLVNDSDPSGYPLTITNVSSNGGGSASIVNGGTQILFHAPTVATRASKTVTLTYTVSNGHGGVASSTIAVFVETEYYD